MRFINPAVTFTLAILFMLCSSNPVAAQQQPASPSFQYQTYGPDPHYLAGSVQTHIGPETISLPAEQNQTHELYHAARQILEAKWSSAIKSYDFSAYWEVFEPLTADDQGNKYLEVLVTEVKNGSRMLSAGKVTLLPFTNFDEGINTLVKNLLMMTNAKKKAVPGSIRHSAENNGPNGPIPVVIHSQNVELAHF
jgi:hypothetical protein